MNYMDEITIATPEQISFIKHFGKKIVEESEEAIVTAYIYEGNIVVTEFKYKENK